RVVVEEVKGFCDLPMAVGDHFFVRGGRLIVPPGKHVCLWALQSMLPLLPLKQRDLAEENDWVPHTSRICCPDPNGMVIFRIEQVAAGAPDGENPEPVADEPEPSQEEGIRRLLVKEAVCSGCRACELACNFAHTRRYGSDETRILVEKDEAKGLDRPVVCRQCGVARCVQVCSAGALSKDAHHAVMVDPERCTGCRACQKACPFHAVRFLPGRTSPLICDLCGGEPACVKRCSTGALTYGTAGRRQS
ncbi:MAG: TIGR04076 family protein, partial [Chitinophagales bacterium]